MKTIIDIIYIYAKQEYMFLIHLLHNFHFKKKPLNNTTPAAKT